MISRSAARVDSAAQGDDMDETDIQYVLGRHLFLKKICIPNVNMYCVGKTEYEADFIYFDLKTRYLTEDITIVRMLNIFITQFREVCMMHIVMKLNP